MTLLSDVAALRQTAPGQVLSGQTRLSQARLRELVGAVATRPESWAGLVRFDAGRRWYRRLELADDYEIWLLSWLPGQGTGFHDHGHAAGAFAVAQGQVRERTVPAGGVRVRERTVAQRQHQVVRPAARARRGQRLRASLPSPSTPTRRRSPRCGGTS